MAIGMTLNKASENGDPSVSKYFGSPVVPRSWEHDFEDSEMFFCQIRLSDIAPFDHDKRLPHTGYLYVFLDTNDGLTPTVRYYDGEPELVIEDFNAEAEGFEEFTQAWEIIFFQTDDDADGTKLFGVPADWPYEEAHPALLLQYDPLDNGTGFLNSTDGRLYLFLIDGDLSKPTVWLEYS